MQKPKSFLIFGLQTKKPFMLFLIKKTTNKKQLNKLKIITAPQILNKKISNIFFKKEKTIVLPKNSLSFNYLTFFYLKELNKGHKTEINTFLMLYFFYMNKSLEILWSNLLSQKFLQFHFFRNSALSLNKFYLGKVGELSYYYYVSTLLNRKKLSSNIALRDLPLNNCWVNLSINNFTQTKQQYLNIKALDFVFNRNNNKIIFKKSNKFSKNFLNLYNKDFISVKTKLGKKYHLFKPFSQQFKTPTNFIYTLIVLENKIEALKESNNEAALSLIKFYNFLKYTSYKKNNVEIQTNFILGKIDAISKLKTNAFDFFVSKTIAKLTAKDSTKFEIYFKKLKSRLFTKKYSKKKKIYKSSIIARKVLSPRLILNKVFKNKKLVLNEQYTKVKFNNKILDVLLNQTTKIFYINALSLTKFGFLMQKKKISTQTLNVNPTKFLANLDREMINKYKYIGVYIKDLIRVAFIALFLKKPAFLAKFIAFQLNVLPKNRRETSFVRFIIKVVKTFAAEREEVWGLKIKFKGRVNRWRRTKVISGQRGIVPLHTIQNRIEYGTAQAINRKGALGIHIWIWYNPVFKTLLKDTFHNYFKYSKYLNQKK